MISTEVPRESLPHKNLQREHNLAWFLPPFPNTLPRFFPSNTPTHPFLPRWLFPGSKHRVGRDNLGEYSSAGVK